MFKNKLIPLVVVVGGLLIFIFQHGLYTKGLDIPSDNPSKSSTQNTDKPEVVSTNPVGLDGATLIPTQAIEINFNIPLENTGEFKHTFVPKLEYTLSLSSDRKTLKITPKTTLALGTNYTLTILPDSKFNVTPGQESTKKVLDHDITFRFKTISYRGV